MIPVAKLANSAKVAQVIEKLKQNLNSSVPPAVDSDTPPPPTTSTTTATTSAPKATSILVSKALPLKATPSNLESAYVNEAAIVGPVASSIVTPSSKQPAPTAANTATTTGGMSKFATESLPATSTQTSSSTQTSALQTQPLPPPPPPASTSEVKISEIAMRTRRKVIMTDDND